MAIGVLLVGIAMIGGIILLIDGGEGESDSGTPQQAAAAEDLQAKFLKKTVVSARDGISVRRPVAWRDSKNNDVITLQSKGRCVAVHLSAAGDAKEARGLMKDSLRSLRSGFKNVEVTPGGRGQLGGIPTTTNAIALTDDEGNRRRVLLSVGRGKRNAYLTEVVLGNPACRADLQLAQIILTSVEYTK